MPAARRGGERHLHATFTGRHKIPRDVSIRLHQGQREWLAERLIVGGKRHPAELRVTLVLQQSHHSSRGFGHDHVDVHIAIPVDGDHRRHRHVGRRQHRVGADVRVLQLSSGFPDGQSLLRGDHEIQIGVVIHVDEQAGGDPGELLQPFVGHHDQLGLPRFRFRVVANDQHTRLAIHNDVRIRVVAGGRLRENAVELSIRGTGFGGRRRGRRSFAAIPIQVRGQDALHAGRHVKAGDFRPRLAQFRLAKQRQLARLQHDHVRQTVQVGVHGPQILHVGQGRANCHRRPSA